MASESFELLLQSVQECVLALNQRETDCRDLARGHPTCADWLIDVAVKLEKLAKGLNRWHDRVKFRRNKQDDYEFNKEVSQDATRCGFLLDLLRKVWDSAEEAVSSTDLTSDEVAIIKANVDMDLAMMTSVAENIKWLEKFFGLTPLNALAKKHKIRTVTLRDLFAWRIGDLDRTTLSFSVFHKGCVNFEHMDFFWENVLRPGGMHHKIGPSETYDGELIRPQHVRKAKDALEQFREAWLDVERRRLYNEECEDYTKHTQSFRNFVLMPIIACVLQACNRRDLFNKFMDSEIIDSAIDEPPATFLERVRKAVRDEADPIEIVAQFSRARQRPWDPGTRLQLQLNEPLPLIKISSLSLTNAQHGQTVEVLKVKDAWDPSEQYLLKVTKSRGGTNDEHTQLFHEIETLEVIQSQYPDCPHLVRFVKTYSRGPPQQQELGLLMTPVANGDLDSILTLCQNGARYRDLYRASLLQACGCLAFGLAYLHNIMEFSHGHIKPHNIFYHRYDLPERFEFLWTELGTGTFFNRPNGGTTPNHACSASPQYEAPEPKSPNPGPSMKEHDIFALGCVFLEICYVLCLTQNNPNPVLEPRRLYWQNGKFYKDHIKGLTSQLQTWNAGLSHKDRELQVILELAQNMIHPNADDRPKIEQIVRTLWHGSSSKLFCEKCHDEIKLDLSRTPKHPGILGSDHEPRHIVEMLRKHRNST